MPSSVSGNESATVPRTSESGAGAGRPDRRREVEPQPPGPEDRVRPRGAHVEDLDGEPVAHALRDEPGPPSAATSGHSSAAAPPTWGVAHDVPPQALIASDSGSPGVISTLVGAEMSGLRRPSSVGPSEEYDSGRSDSTSNAPTEKEPARVARASASSRP